MGQGSGEDDPGDPEGSLPLPNLEGLAHPGPRPPSHTYLMSPWPLVSLLQPRGPSLSLLQGTTTLHKLLSFKLAAMGA